MLYVAVLLHDIAKGRPEDHSEAGARIARRICPHMGLSAADTETVAWLVENHLLMSMTAQTRDLNDRKTIDDFADVVQSVERLKLLLILTVCDIRGVGPGVWNGWKGQLLRTLYYETELLLTGGFSEVSRAERAAAARERLAEALADWPEKDAQALCRAALRELPADRRPRTTSCATPNSSARRTRPARSSPPWSRRTSSRRSPRSPCWRRTIRACCR